MFISVILATAAVTLGTAVSIGKADVDSNNLSLPSVIWIKKIDDYRTLRGLTRLEIFKEIS